MAVWGIGAYYPGEQEDKAKQFVEKGRIIIGYGEEEHPDYYVMLRSIKPGDIVFIKSRFMLNKPMRIKAIGIAVDYQISEENGMDNRLGMKVNWIKDLTDQPIDIEKGKFNDGSTRTIYQEMDSKIINQIAELLNE